MLTENQKLLIYWIIERNKIRQSKDCGNPAPWSKDPIFQATYFTNVNREEDKVTKWIRTNWTYPTFKDDFEEICSSYESYTLAIMAARLFNLPSTLAEIRQPIDGEEDLWLDNLGDVLYHLKEKGQTIWNGAYIVSTNGKKISKAEYCVGLLRKAKPQLSNMRFTSLAETHKQLMKVEGLASFLAAQIVADLKNTADHPLYEAEDWWDFSAYGPGSLRGLSWFWGNKITPATYDSAIQDAMGILQWELPEQILSILCMQNLQNCFCEFDKYMRILNNSGRSKRKYNGKGK